MIKVLLISFTMFLQAAAYGDDKYDQAIVQKKYKEIYKELNGQDGINWKHYHYLSVASYFLGDQNKAILNSVKSILLNPLSIESKSNFLIFSEGNRKSLDHIVNISKIHLLMTVLALGIFLLLILLRKKKFVVIMLLIFQCSISIGYFLSIQGHKIRDLSHISLQSSKENTVRISPSDDSPINSSFKLRSILMLGRKLSDWRYVETLEGDAGWINENDLILLK